MKKVLQSIAAFVLISVVSSPLYATVMTLDSTDYQTFGVLSDTPTGSANVLFNPFSDQISVNWLSAANPYSVYWGSTDTLGAGVSSINSGLLLNSSITSSSAADDIEFGLFVETAADGYIVGTVQKVADNAWFGVSIDLSSISVTDVISYGMFVGSSNIATAHAKVPEPATLVLLGLGLLGMGAASRRRA